MLRNYLVVALRNLRRSRGYASINVAGLALGLACGLLIFQYVSYERSFDGFNTNADRLFRVTQTTARTGDDPETWAGQGYGLAPALQESIPEVAAVARVHPLASAIVSIPGRADATFEEPDVLFADPALLSMFSFPLVAGSPAQALREPGTVLLSASAAARYFGSADPIGQVLSVTGWSRQEVRVTGVFADVPATSHLRFSVLMPLDDILKDPMYAAPGAGWEWNNFYTYVQLRGGADAQAAQRGATAVLLQHEGERLRESNMTASLGLQPLRDVYLDASITAWEIPGGNAGTVRFLTIVGVVILLIALVNYVNLATARAAARAREVGVRKAVGAARRELVLQFLTESALTNAIALVLALGITVALQPLLSSLAGADLSGTLWTNPWLWATFAAAFVGGTLVAGLYPAVVLSSFRPASALRGGASATGGHAGLRRVLVVSQFAASVVLIAGMFIVYSQLRYVRSLDLGLALDQVITVPAPRVQPDGADRAAQVQALKDALAAVPSVRVVSSSYTVPGTDFNQTTPHVRRAEADEVDAVDGSITPVDAAFADAYGFQIVAGHGFTDEMARLPEDAPVPVLASETAVRALGFTTNEAALDQDLVLGGPDHRIVGVFRDVRWTSAHQPMPNAFLVYAPAGHTFSVKIEADHVPQTLAAIEAAYTGLFPGNPFTYTFADAQYDRQYQNDQRFGALFAAFAGLAIVIACLGLFGLAAFTAEQRRKEVGVRKVLGSSVGGLLLLFSKDFVRLVLIGAAVATPLAYRALGYWLETFADHVALGPLPFLAATALALGVAVAAVVLPTVRAATADPVKALRSE